MKRFEQLGTSLSKVKMKKITGGYVGGGNTFCRNDDHICYVDGHGKEYKCFTLKEGEQEIDCCCGHDAGNQDCYAM